MMKHFLGLIAIIIVTGTLGCGGNGGGGVDPEQLAQLLADAAAALNIGDFDDANTLFSSAMNLDPSSTNANIGWAVTQLAVESDDFSLFFDPTAEPFFRKTTSFCGPISFALNLPGKLTGATSPVMGLWGGVEREGNTDKTSLEIQAEIESHKPLLDSIANALKKGRSGIISAGNEATWFLRIPKDVNDLPAGYYQFDYGDLVLLLGCVEMSRGWVDFLISINITGIDEVLPDGSYDDPLSFDTNGDDILTPEEYFPDAPCMTIRAGYSSTMRGVDDKISGSIQYIAEGIDITLAEATDNNELLPINMDDVLREGLHEVRSFIDDFSAAFADSGAVFNTTDFDEYAPSIPFTVSFKHLFDPVISDWRDVAPNLIVNEWGDADLPPLVEEAFDDTTLNGIFVGGIGQDFYDYWAE